MVSSSTHKNFDTSFQDYLKQCKGEVANQKKENYYSVDVVADAYSTGYADGQSKGISQLVQDILSKEMENFSAKANQIYILSKKVVKQIGSNANGLFLNLSMERPSAIISIPEEKLVDDKFIEEVYAYIFELKNIFSRLFDETLDISLVPSEGLEIELLEEDGYTYHENYHA